MCRGNGINQKKKVGGGDCTREAHDSVMQPLFSRTISFGENAREKG